MKNLFSATKAIGNDQGFRSRLPNGGKQDALPDGLRKSVLLFFKAEGTGHAAATRINGLQLDSHFAEKGFFIGHLH